MDKSCKLNKINDIQLLKDRIYQNIKSSIIELRLYPGEQLTEQASGRRAGGEQIPHQGSPSTVGAERAGPLLLTDNVGSLKVWGLRPDAPPLTASGD